MQQQEQQQEQQQQGTSSEAWVDNRFKERGPERRTDPMLATLVDVAIAYRENLGCRVAQAFMRETGVPTALVQRVLTGAAQQRSGTPRRWTARPAAARSVADAPTGERPD